MENTNIDFNETYDNFILKRIEFWKTVYYFRHYFKTKAKESRELKEKIKEAFRSENLCEGSPLMYKRHLLRRQIRDHHCIYKTLREKRQNDFSAIESLPEFYRQKIAEYYDSQNVRSN